MSRSPVLHDQKWCALCLTLSVPKGPENRVEDMINVGCCGDDTPIVLIPKGNRSHFSANNPPLNHDRVLLFGLWSNTVLKIVLSWLLYDPNSASCPSQPNITLINPNNLSPVLPCSMPMGKGKVQSFSFCLSFGKDFFVCNSLAVTLYVKGFS